MVSRRWLRQRLRTPYLVLAMCALATPANAAFPRAHPLHTSITDAIHDRAKQTLTLTVRVFADDFLAAVTPSPTSTSTSTITSTTWRSNAITYLSRTIAIHDARGKALPLAPCGIQEAADVLLICVRAGAVAEVRGLQIRNTILFEKFEDQLSIVRVTTRERTQTFILSRKSDSAKVR